MTLFHRLWAILTPRERVIVVVLTGGMLSGAALEAVAVGLLLPFVAIVGNAGTFQEQPWLARVMRITGITAEREILGVAAAGLLAFYIVKNAFLVILTYSQFRFVYRTQSAVSCRLLRRYLAAPWTFHLQRNTAELLRNINSEVELVFGNVLNPAIVLVTEIAVTVAVVVLLMLVDPLASLAALGILGGSSAVFYRAIRRRSEQLGKAQQSRRGSMIKWINQAFGGIKEVKVLGREDYFVNVYRDNSTEYARGAKYLATISQAPRFVLETLIVIVVLLVWITKSGNAEGNPGLVPILALFGAAAYRLMPSISRIGSATANIRYHRASVDVVYNDLVGVENLEGDGPKAEAGERRFEHEIKFTDVTYRYPSSDQDSLKRVTFEIPKGKSVALIGPSGAGKTTVADVMLGLLRPTEGKVLVDGRDIHENLDWWRRQIGYIPQSIYLSDDTIRRNVAFGVPDPDIDEQRVAAAIELAQLEDVVREVPDGLNTVVGERGVRLSGGQRQRIGLARALYHDPEVLVMDEATSALDSDTEREVVSAIERLNGRKTVIIIAHRVSTIEKCDIRLEMRSGRIADAYGRAAIAGVSRPDLAVTCDTREQDRYVNE